MITHTNQRWRDQQGSYRPTGEVIDTQAYEVAAITEDRIAKRFVQRHHYSGTYPAARFRFGLYRSSQLVGVAVFSVPCNYASITSCIPGDARNSVELGRFVLLDDVEANGESWFIARCFESLRAHGLTGVISFSDPEPRHGPSGDTIFAGHVGTIYQATNAVYLGRSRAARKLLFPDGTVLHARSLAKVRAQHRGWRHVVAQIQSHGAEPLQGDPGVWVDRAVAQVCVVQRHGGNHKYCWALDRRARRHLPESQPYPKASCSVGGPDSSRV